MPVSLDKMLSQHTQSMFEFLAPRRQISGAAAAVAAGHRVPVPSGQQGPQQQLPGGAGMLPSGPSSAIAPGGPSGGGQPIPSLMATVVAPPPPPPSLSASSARSAAGGP